MRSRVGLVCALVLGAALASFVGCQTRTPSSTPLGGVDEPTVARREPEREASKKSARKSAKEKDVEKDQESDDESESDEKDGEEAAGGASNDDEDKDSPKSAKSSFPSTTPGPGSGQLAGRDLPPLCDDSKPATLNCRPLGDKCPPLAPVCTLLETTFKPKVGQAIVDCAVTKECGIAQFECLRPALRKSCVDERAKSFCAERSKSCKREYQKADVTQSDCEHGLASLLPDVRAKMEACMSDSCDVRGCIGKVLPSPVSAGDEDEED